MKKIKLPLEMANGVMVRTLDELKENWDLEKIVGYFGDGRLVTWLNDRYYKDLAEQVEKITAKGAEAQKELCAVFGMEFKQDEVVDAEALAERKRKLDILRQFTSDDEVLKSVDHVAFNQEDLADLLDEGVEKIYLCNGKFSVPLNISGKKYIGVADAEVYIGKDELQDFEKLGISFENVKFDEKYQNLINSTAKECERDDNTVILYVCRQCPNSALAERLLMLKGVAYKKIVIDDNKEVVAKERVMQVPTLSIGNNIFVGLGEIRKYVASAR